MLLIAGLTVHSASARLLSETEREATNQIELRGGVVFQLPALPEDPELLMNFQALSPEQQGEFYVRRKFLIQKLVGTLSFPRTLGGMAWAKGSVKSFIRRLKGAPEQRISPAETLAPQDETQSIKERGQLILSKIVDMFTDKLWSDATYVAQASSVGFTLYAGPVLNMSLAKWGVFWGRGLSIDIGHDFQSENGYVRLYYDRQSLARAGLSLDVGAMFDFFIHFTNVPLASTGMNVVHYKLPVIGSYRSGPDYRGYGLQLGVNVLDFAGAAIAYKHPEIATAMFTGTRILGSATIYSTDLKRKQLAAFSIPETWMQRLFSVGKSDLACEEDLSAAPFEN